MSRVSQINLVKKHLENSRIKLLERSASYKFIDENVSDDAAYKAMKLSRKINQLNYLESSLM